MRQASMEIGTARTAPLHLWPQAGYADPFPDVHRIGVLRGQVKIIGGAQDAAIAKDVLDHARRLVPGQAAGMIAAGRIASLAGLLSLAEVAQLLSHASAFLGNDSGPRNLAQALGCPTVAVFWGPNAINSAPFSRTWHGVHLGWRTICPLCGAPSALGTERCPHDVSYVDDVSPETVYADLSRLLT